MQQPDPIQEAEDIQQYYRNVLLGSAEGRKVLGDILLSLGHFGMNPIDPVQVAEMNFAIVIARMAGAFDPLYQQLSMTTTKGA